MIYGAVWIGKVVNQGERINAERFRIDMKNALARNIEKGNIEVVTFNLPGDFSHVCFIDSDYFLSEPRIIDLVHIPANNPIGVYIINNKIVDAPATNPENMFLYPPGTDSYAIGKIATRDSNDVDEPFICIETQQGTITLKLEGEGAKTIVQPPQS